LIIELFGPPGAGKTTLSHQLARRLTDCGLRVELALSQRPAEASARGATGGASPQLAIIRRIVRPTLQLLRFGCTAEIREDGLRQADSLVRLFPQRSPIRVLRLRQYLIRLQGRWRQAMQAQHVVIFDQAFVQTVFSLACTAGVSEPETLDAAMRSIPSADLLIDVHAPLALLQSRLQQRLQGQGRLERLFERDAFFSSSHMAVLEGLRQHLGTQGRRVIATQADDPHSSRSAIEAVRKALAIPPAGRRLLQLLALAATLMLAHAAGPMRWVAEAGGRAKPTLHFTPGENFEPSGAFAPGRAGFNLADVSIAEQLKTLPKDTRALVWIGTCDGDDAAFRERVKPFAGNPKVFGYYLMDDPDPTGRWRAPCPPEKLRSEADWIRLHHPGAKTFIALMNLSSSEKPSFQQAYTPANSHVDLFGLGPYPCRSGRSTCDLDMIDRFVKAALAAGIERRRIVPVFQAFGEGEWRDDEGGSYTLPSPDQAAAMLRRWSMLVPTPVFDFTYSWGRQRNDRSLADDAALIEVFRRHNGRNAASAASDRTVARGPTASTPIQ
jgi:hypothetical protein